MCPVQLEVKEFHDAGAKLYLDVVLTKIEAEVLGTTSASDAGGPLSLLSASTIISLRQLFENVNPADGRFLKYVPDGFLNEAQKNAKAQALRQQEQEYAGYGAKFSDRDSAGRELSAEQAEYFKDSKVRDKDGNLLVMYHGTANGGSFTVFQSGKLSNNTMTSQIGQGFYFTNVKKEAMAYMQNVDIYGRSKQRKRPYLHEVYLDIRSPFRIGVDSLNLDDAKAVYMDGNYDYFFNNWIPFYLNNKKLDGRTLTKTEVQQMSKDERVSLYVDYLARTSSKAVLMDMVRAYTYDGQDLLLQSMKRRLGYDGISQEYGEGKYQCVALSPEQIKNVDNRFPTTDPDIRYSERVTDKKTLDFLNRQKTVKTYKTMQLVDGKLYPPMAARTNGQYEDYSVLGQWEQATEHPELVPGRKVQARQRQGAGKPFRCVQSLYALLEPCAQRPVQRRVCASEPRYRGM